MQNERRAETECILTHLNQSFCDAAVEHSEQGGFYNG
jgi:hypothetical protein